MNGIRAAGVGVALTLSAAPVAAQQPATPAASLGRVTTANDPPADPVVRGAPPDSRPTSLFPRRNQTDPPGTGSTGPLPPPRPVDGQPNVTETLPPPGGNPAAPVPVPGAGYPVPGTMYPPNVVPGAYSPYPAYPHGGLGTPAPTYLPPSGPAFVAPPPVGYPTPSPTMAGPLVTGPVTGDGVPCDPYTGGALGTPIAPPPSGVVGTPEVPYWGGGWDPLFPRARAAVTSAVNTALTPFTQGRFVLGGEYLLWWARAQKSPPLLTTSSPAFNGIIGQGDTRVLYGGQTVTDTRHNGARFSAAYWLNDLWALDGNVWFLARSTGGFSADSSQFPVLARPFVNANTGANFSQVIASPGLATGAAVITAETSLWGAEANFRRAILCQPCARVDALVGFRNFNLMEELNIVETFARTPNSPPGVGVPNVTGGVVQDRFRTENNFYGVNLGLAGELRRSWWFLSGRVGVGLGTVNQFAEIAGSQQLNTTGGGTIFANGGLLALPGANIGRFSQSRFGVLPEAGLTAGVYLTPNLRLGVGYNFMYLNSVVRPAGQIDPALDVTRIPNFPVGTVPAVGTVRPSVFPLRTTDFFVQGVTFSLMWTF